MNRTTCGAEAALKQQRRSSSAGSIQTAPRQFPPICRRASHVRAARAANMCAWSARTRSLRAATIARG
eukprot:10434026-Lingulodinium_polyedra.AAC.1